MNQPARRAAAAAPDMSAPLLAVRDLRRVFDVSKPFLNRLLEGAPRLRLKAVDGVTFTVDRGETFALVGESGCGKSTVARLVVGLMQPSAGEIAFEGVDIADPDNAAALGRLRRRFQMIFQDPYASLNPRWRVEDIIAEPIRAFGMAQTRAEIADQVGGLLRTVKLDAADGRKFPHEFSGGQRQRICIARALSNRPEFIVCDEPTSALDVSVQAQILNLMRDLQDEFGLTYLFISHDLAVVRHMATRIGVMYLGRLVEVAPAKQLFRNPQHPYTRMLLDAVPDLGMSGRARQPVKGEVPNPISPPSGCAFHPRCPFANDRCRAERPQVMPHSAAEGEAEIMVACHAVAEGRLEADLGRAGPVGPVPAVP